MVFDILKGKRGKAVCSSPVVTCTRDQMEAAQAFYPRAHCDAVQMAALGEAAYRVAGFEGIRVPFDLCVEAEAFGCRIKPGDEETAPSVLAPAFAQLGDWSIPDDLFQRGRFPVVERALAILLGRYGAILPLYAGIAGPLTLASYLFGVEKVMKGMIRTPEALGALLNQVADFNACYAQRLLAAGGNVLVLIDPTASGDLISRRVFERFLLPAYRKIRAALTHPVILHICGNTNHFLSSLPETGFEGFSFEGPAVGVKAAREGLRGKMALVGNISTTDTLLLGDAARVKREVEAAIAEGIDLVAPSCGIPLRAPLANLHAMVEATRNSEKGFRQDSSFPCSGLGTMKGDP